MTSCSMSEAQEEKKFDKIARWAVLGLSGAGTLLYLFALITEMDRIARDFWEDGIILGLCYMSCTFAGVLRHFRPQLPPAFNYAAAFANVLIGYVVIMFWYGLFTGKIDRGAEIVPVLMTAAYILVLRVICIREYFAPQRWFVNVVIVVTMLNFVIPEILYQQSRSHGGMQQVAIIDGVLQFVTVVVWIAFVAIGFKRALHDRK